MIGCGVGLDSDPAINVLVTEDSELLLLEEESENLELIDAD